MYSSVQIGLNNLCSFCGIPENTMKDRFGDILWKMLITRNGRNGMDSVKTPVLYCAMDVEGFGHTLFKIYFSFLTLNICSLILSYIFVKS